jgi:predicted ATP-binding protein involved in virulence
MQDLELLLSKTIRIYDSLKEGDKHKLIELARNILGLGFEIQYSSIYLHLIQSGYGICSLQIVNITDETFIFLKKFSKSSKDIIPIQNEKTYFDKYWNNNIYRKIFAFDESLYRNAESISTLSELGNVLKQIKNVFLDDIVVDFRFESIAFKDYRCFKDENFVFNPTSTVLLGKNASGKTSILEGLTVALGGFLSGIDESTDSKTISAEDIRFTSKEEEGAPITDHHPPSIVYFTTKLMDEKIQWSRTRNSLTSTKITTKDSNVITYVVRQLVEDIRNEKVTRNIVLPVFSYHGTGRVANFTRDMGLLERTEKISRFVGYKDCLKAASNYKFFLAWYRKMKLRAFEMQRQIPSLNAVTDAINKCLKLLTDDEGERRVETILYFEGQIHAKFLDGEVFPISFLSDGYQDVIGIVSDIAYRMAILNPKLGGDILQTTPGVVLIDEVDLHLHPKWQQKILYVLKNIFPKVQFITTTHSAIVISTTDDNEALELSNNNGEIFAHPVGNPRDWYIADILKQAFHIEKKPLFVTQEDSTGLSLEERIQNFSNAIKEYLVIPTEEGRIAIQELYNDILPSLPDDSPKRRAVDSLMGLI